METFKNICKYFLIPASLISLIELGRLASNGQHGVSGVAIGAFVAMAIISSMLSSAMKADAIDV